MNPTTACVHGLPTCIEAGMNDHVAKPINPEEFLRIVARYIVPDRDADLMGDIASPVEAQDLPDVDEAHLDGLARLLPAARFETMLGVYLAGAKDRMSRIEAFGETLDFAAIGGEAHDVKSTSGNFGARRVQLLAEHLETASRAADAAAVAALIPPLRAASNCAWDIIGGRLTGAPVIQMKQAS